MQHPMLTIALRAARKAGHVIAKHYEITDTLKSYQKNRNKFTSNIANKASETIIIETIRKYYPQHTIFAKDSGKLIGSNPDVQWIIDPLDGTINFLKRLPHFSISIAIRIKDRTEVALVYDPMRNELFTTVRGQGAQLNGYRLRISSVQNLDGTILGSNFPFKAKQYTNAYINILGKLFTKFADFRSSGSPSLDLAYVAAGRVDGYFEIALKPWNFAAGELIVRESGGVIYDFIGGHNYMITGNLVAGSPRIAKAILENICVVT